VESLFIAAIEEPAVIVRMLTHLGFLTPAPLRQLSLFSKAKGAASIYFRKIISMLPPSIFPGVAGAYRA
jgi:hypothetical protein